MEVRPQTFVFHKPRWMQILGIYCTAITWGFDDGRLQVLLQRNRFGWYPPFGRLGGPDPKRCVREAYRKDGIVKLRVGVQVPVTSQWLLKRVFGWLAWTQAPVLRDSRPKWCYADELPSLHPGFGAVVVDGVRTLQEDVLPIVFAKMDTVASYVPSDDWFTIKKALRLELPWPLRNVLSIGKKEQSPLERLLAARLVEAGRRVVFRS